MERRHELPVKAGHGCIACASPRFWDTKSPFYERLPHAAGFGVDATVGQIGWTVVGAVAAATAAHGARKDLQAADQYPREKNQKAT